MNSAVNILNVQTAPAQTQVRTARQNADNIVSFLSLLQNAANSGRTEVTGNSDNFSNNNLNRPVNLENKGMKNILNADAKINDINNAGNNADGVSVLAKVLNGGTEDLADFEEINIIEEIKKEFAEIVVRDKEDEKIDVSKVLEILGVPAEIIPEIIAAVIEPEIILEDIEQTQEVIAVNTSESINSERINAPVLVSAGEAEQLISEISEYIYSENLGEIISSAEVMPEQVQENIADFAGIIEETGDFKGAVASYAAEKIEASNAAAGTVNLNAENIREVIRQVLNEEPELEIISGVRTSEADSEKPAIMLFDISSSMRARNTVNIMQVQPVVAEMTENNLEADIVQDIEGQLEISDAAINNSGEINRREIRADATAAEISINEPEVNDLAGISNVRVNAQNPEVNIESFSRDIAQLITEKSNGLLINQPGERSAEVFELRLRLKPEALGDVFLKITYRDGNVGLNIIAANAAAERAILSQMGDLRESLSAQEIKLTDFDVNSFNQNAQSNQRNNGRERSRTSNLNNNISEVRAQEEAERREAVANYIRSRRIFYKTI